MKLTFTTTCVASNKVHELVVKINGLYFALKCVLAEMIHVCSLKNDLNTSKDLRTKVARTFREALLEDSDDIKHFLSYSELFFGS